MENANNLVNPVKTEENVKEKGPITKTPETEVAAKEAGSNTPPFVKATGSITPPPAKATGSITPPPAKATGEEHKIIKEEVMAEMPAVASIEETSEKDENKRLNKMKKQTLCKLVKNNSLKKHPDEYQELVADAKYICLKCGRIAKDKASLCKPKLMNLTQE